jgi:Ca-activated chloride channel homolog
MMKPMKAIILSIFLTTALAGAAAAQDEPLRVETNLVTLNVAVTDKNGNYVKNLKREDFTVYDGGEKREVGEFSAAEAPIYFGIVYDMHPATGEMSAQVLEALRSFSRGLAPKDNFFVTVFNERGSLTTDFVPNAAQIDQNLTDARPATPNSLYDAIFAASAKVRERRDAKKVLLVLTDGEDHASHHNLKELRLHLRSVNLPIYTVAFHDEKRREWGYSDLYREGRRQILGATETSQLDTAALAEISKTSGGQAFTREIQNRFYLRAIFDKVRAEVESQYVIGFYPESFDGRWRKLKVGVRSPQNQKYKLSSRRGYLSPARAAKGR